MVPFAKVVSCHKGEKSSHIGRVGVDWVEFKFFYKIGVSADTNSGAALHENMVFMQFVIENIIFLSLYIVHYMKLVLRCWEF